MKGKIIQVDWDGVEEFAKLLMNMTQDQDKIVIQEYSKFGLLVEEGAKALAPRDKSDLSDSINSTKAEKIFDEITVAVEVNSEYGLRRHEEPPRKGYHDKYDRGALFPDYYLDGRGLKTRGKPSWRGEQPGRKYLQRAVNKVDKDFDEMNRRAMDRIMGVK